MKISREKFTTHAWLLAVSVEPACCALADRVVTIGGNLEEWVPQNGSAEEIWKNEYNIMKSFSSPVPRATWCATAVSVEPACCVLADRVVTIRGNLEECVPQNGSAEEIWKNGYNIMKSSSSPSPCPLGARRPNGSGNEYICIRQIFGQAIYAG